MRDRIDRIVVVGGSIAAVESATTLRRLGYAGQLTMVSAEQHPPYSRVPLSKGVLAGIEAPDSTYIAGIDDGIVIRRGVHATKLDRRARLVTLDNGDDVSYDRLIVATGARAQRLTANGLVVRTLDDCLLLRHRMDGAGSAVVIGGGFLGMEIASTCTDLGLATTVIDRDPPLQRLAGPTIARHLTAAAVARGVRVLTGAVADLDTHSVRTRNGQTVHADVVIEAVGDAPNVEWLDGSGLRISDGVMVDNHCRAAPEILAAGDVSVVAGRRRTPHWANALEQAHVAAAAALHGAEAPECLPNPYYWTEQFGVTLRVVGDLPTRGHQIDVGQPGLLAWHDGQAITSVAAMNNRMPLVRMRRLLGATPAMPLGRRG